MAQFFLLLWKNLILMKRSKLWTLFEFVLPILFTLPIVLAIMKLSNISLNPAQSFDPVRISGDGSDIRQRVGFVKPIIHHWCLKDGLKLGYSSSSNQNDAAQLMKAVEQRYQNVKLSIVPFETYNALLEELKNDAPNDTVVGCNVNRYAGGVYFKELNLATRRMDYQILMFAGGALDTVQWQIDSNWDDPYGPTVDFNRIPTVPPYWSNGFLSFQHAIDSVFLANTSGSSVETEMNFYLQRLPEPEYRVNSVSAFVKFLPIMWGLCSFLSVIHAARDVAHEKQTVKAFLSVMGLNARAFYLSHIVFSWAKCVIIFMACAIPLCTVLTNVNVGIFLFTMIVYALGAVSFGVLVASIFKTSNSALKATIVLWVVLVGIVYVKTPRLEDQGSCFVTSLNINAAFYYAVTIMSDYMYKENSLGPLNLFEGGAQQFTVGFALIMMVLDVFWMIGLTFFFDHVLSADFSLRNFFQNRESEDLVDGKVEELLPDSIYHEKELRKENADILVENLVKVWPETGERAVDRLSFAAHKGQVTVLLGHNGAGKSTTFSILCGLVQGTAGEVKICRRSIHFHDTQTQIGLCPQGNAIFDRLTVSEHLRLIHGLKRATNNLENDADRLLKVLKLEEKTDELAETLSGGMKRKLCVAMALIGDSRVVMLDEPTAGMDTGARDDVKKLLEHEKASRTILLTTHYMDEAESLGERVLIMWKGRGIAFGPIDFLKDRFGKGYIMTLVAQQDVDVEKIADRIETLAQSYVNGATKNKVLGQQIEIKLPKDEAEKFPAFLEQLEKDAAMYGVASWGLSLNTLQQVFLDVGELAQESNKSGGLTLQVESDTKNLISSQKDPRYTGFPLFLSQVRAIVTKRWLYSIRNWPQLITQIVFPLMILFFVVYLTNFKRSGSIDQGRSLSYESFGPNRVILQKISPSMEAIASSYGNISKVVPDWMLSQFSANDNFTNRAISMPKTLPATGLGALFENGAIKAVFNSRAFHSLPASLNLLSNAILRSKGEGKIDVSIFTFAPKVDGSTNVFSSGIIDNILGPLLVLSLALVTSAFVMFLVEERVSKFAHQQSLSGISPFTFWLVSFVYDAVFYFVVCSIFLVVFLVSGWLKGYLTFVVILWALYFWACMPFIYAISFMFSSPSKANVILVIWQIVAAFAAMLIMLIVSMIQVFDHKTTLEVIRSALLFFLPSFALGNGLLTLGTFSASKADPNLVWEWNNLGKNMFFMGFYGCFSLALFVAFQFKSFRYFWFKIWDLRYMYSRRPYTQVAHSSGEELQVADTTDGSNVSILKPGERNPDPSSSSSSAGSSTSSSSLALEVKDMTKMYGNLTAVDHLNMNVHNRECFGLLGVNGAGKTTTFDILTGQSFPTHGSAKIDNRDVTEQIAIGYCPQFDAMLNDLTGKETLTILARLYGFLSPEEKADKVLRAVGMYEHRNKLVRYYSGGQRRKMSVGLALIAETRIVILDEPTAGIDPKARRDIWDVLSSVRDFTNTSILLTSHIMEECETLCNRIAILNKGRLVTVGTSQELKSRYGNKYILSITAPSIEVRQTVIDDVHKIFPAAELKTRNPTTLSLIWQIDRQPNDLWSAVFRTCLDLAKTHNCEFSLTQSSLEEAFLRLSQDEPEKVPVHQSPV